MKEQRFSNKNAVIIGGNSGIGLATAAAFAREGARVAIIGRNPDTLEKARQNLGDNAIAIRADITSLEDIARAANELKAQMPNVDALFANAGTGGMMPFGEVSETLFDSIMNVNFKGIYFAVQHILPLLNRGSSIVLCSSLSSLRSWPGSTVYSASKAAINSLGRGLATELISEGIRVNTIIPGGVDTPIFNRAMPDEVARSVKTEMASHAPMQRLATPEEIADGVLFLASEQAAYMTGSEMVMDGGIVGCSN